MLHKAYRVMCLQLRENLFSGRVLLLFVLLAMFVGSTVAPMNDFASAYDLGITPWAFPLLCNDYICQLVLMMGAVVLFSNAPFQDELHIYIVTRSGRTAWALGICLYLAAVSLIYVLLMVLTSLLAVLPHLELSDAWGKAWNAIGTGSYRYEYGVTLQPSRYILGRFTPWDAALYSFGLEWACCLFLGLVSYAVSALCGSTLGTLTAAGFVVLDIAVSNDWSPWCYHISPVSMAQLANLASAQSIYGLSWQYAVQFFAGSIVLLTGLSLWLQTGKRRKTHE